jgi:DNA-binding winged helix-turn-helix (wHTH) protein/tetratricopeptide (TPR) repeat protein
MEIKHLYGFGPFQIDSARRLLQRDLQPIPLSTKAFEALLLLVRNSDRLVEKDELMRALWPDTVVEENNLSQSISAIRKALGDSSQEQRYIETVPGWGYRFAAKVTIISDAKSAEVIRSHELPTRRPDHKSLITRVAVATVLIVAAVFYLSSFGRRQFYGSRQPDNSVVSSPRRSVAVLGFENLSNDNKDEWLSTALSEMLSTELAAGDTLRIVSGEDVARAKTEIHWRDTGTLAKDTLQRIHRNLGSELLILGSYTAIGDESRRRIRLDLRLENAMSGELIAEIAESGPEGNLFDVVSRAGIRLRQKLGLSDLSPDEVVAVSKSLPSNPRAAQLYSDGLAKLRVFDAIGARDKLLKAVALEPDYPLAHSALTDAWSVLGYDAKAEKEARQAFELSKTLSPEDRLSVEGRYRVAIHDWTKAVAVYSTILALFPDDLDYGLRLASAQTAAAKAHDALTTLDRLHHFPLPAGNDPRIDLEASRAWNSLGDFKQMDVALAGAVRNAEIDGAQLLLARARNQQCFVWRFLGEQQKAINACREAQRIYSAAGDRGGEADTLRLLADVISDSDVPGAMLFYQQSLSVQREIGHLSGQAIVLNELAIQYSTGGDHADAKKFFRQARAIFQQLGSRVSATGMMINIGHELGSEGRLEEARKMYQRTSDDAVALGNKDIEGLATVDIAQLDQSEGNLDHAQLLFQQARELFTAVDDKAQLTNAIDGLGEIEMLKGDFDTAQKLFEEALAVRQSAYQTVPAAETQLDLALLSLEKREATAELEAAVQQAMDVFRHDKAIDDEAVGTALLARILLSRGKAAESLAMAQHATLLSTKADVNARLSVAVNIARIHQATDRTIGTRVLANLKSTIAQARKLGYFETELQGRLTLAEIEMKSGALTRGRIDLEAVNKDATNRGFTVIARKAASSSG